MFKHILMPGTGWTAAMNACAKYFTPHYPFAYTRPLLVAFPLAIHAGGRD